MSADLRFWKSPGGSNLLFGETEVPLTQHVEGDLGGALQALGFGAAVIPDRRGDMVVSFAALSFGASGEYNSRAQRPTVGKAASDWQVAVGEDADTSALHAEAPSLHHSDTSPWQEAARTSRDATALHEDSIRVPLGTASRFQDALRVDARDAVGRHQDSTRLKQSRSSRFQDAAFIRNSRNTNFQDGIRIKQARTIGHQDAARLAAARHTASAQVAMPLDQWLSAWHQDAKRPGAGTSGSVAPPQPPEREWLADLLFAKLYDGSPNILFGWTDTPSGGTVVIAPRSVYMVINDVSLTRVSNNLALPPTAFSLRIDVDSWTWGFSASFPAHVLSDLEPNSFGDPVELEAEVNGNPYRVLVESISRERQFGEATISVSGRGKTAHLDAPYSPILTFDNVGAARTAQQLMNDALLLNGVPFGWSVDWQITDWLVPDGAWAYQGSRIAALKAIAETAGAYLAPHPTLQQIAVKARYPVAPWEWSGETPDFSLPAALTVREGIEWTEKFRYDAVYLQGTGLLSNVKRTGSAGELLAQMVVDPLLTHADAHRQRGISILADTGRQAMVSLRIPVLPATGVIEPGALIDYVDGGTTRRGIVRSTEVSVGYPEVFQSLGVQTYA